MMWGGDGGGWWNWMWLAHGIWWWLPLFIGIVVLVRWIGRSQPGTPTSTTPESALDVLKKRYARGEIDREEFARRKAGLD